MSQAMLLVFARAAGLLFRAPGFGHPAVPPMVRLGIALALAAAIAPTVGPQRDIDIARLSLAVAGELAVGAAMGIGAALLYDGAYYGGRMIDDYVGFRASAPTAAVTSAQGFGRLWSSLFLAGFFLLGGDSIVLSAFAESFTHLGPGMLLDPAHWDRFALVLPTTIVRTALVVAAPAIAVGAAIQLAIGAVGRVVPRFASLTLAFPVVLAAAIVVAVVTLPLYAPLAARPLLLVPYGVR